MHDGLFVCAVTIRSHFLGAAVCAPSIFVVFAIVVPSPAAAKQRRQLFS